MAKRIAIIDLGTNTFHLLIAEAWESGYNIIYRDRLAVKIGMGGINSGFITEEAIHRALVAMQSFRNIMALHHVESAMAFGTSALRNARNGSEVINRIREITSIDARIITGGEEADYIYKGVRAAVDMGNDKNLIIDIGGGSVEFIIGDQHAVVWKQSFEIGAQRLLEQYQKHDPILPGEISVLNEYFSRALEPLFVALRKYQPRIMVGSSGTFDTLSDIFCIRHDIHKSPEEIETPLTIEGFDEIHKDVISKNRAERMAIPGMIEMRVDMIVVASCLIRFLLDNHSFQRIRVSTYSLKEGVLADLTDKLHSSPGASSTPK